MDCIAETAEEYVELALRLGTDLVWRNQIETKIRDKCHLLFNRSEAIHELEEFFVNAVEAV